MVGELMNPLEFLNENPAILSVVAFPLGLILLLAVGKLFGLHKGFKEAIDALKAHTAAEVKIEERLTSVVSELRNVLAANWDNRRYIDDVKDYFTERFDHLETAIENLSKIMPKRKEDISS
jgi:hypothetical protein